MYLLTLTLRSPNPLGIRFRTEPQVRYHWTRRDWAPTVSGVEHITIPEVWYDWLRKDRLFRRVSQIHPHI